MPVMACASPPLWGMGEGAVIDLDQMMLGIPSSDRFGIAVGGKGRRVARPGYRLRGLPFRRNQTALSLLTGQRSR